MFRGAGGVECQQAIYRYIRELVTRSSDTDGIEQRFSRGRLLVEFTADNIGALYQALPPKEGLNV